MTLVVILSNMIAKSMLYEHHILSDNAFVEMVVSSLPAPASKSPYNFKYRLALVVKGNCVLRYDNEPAIGYHTAILKSDPF
jgi:hypothetical protein